MRLHKTTLFILLFGCILPASYAQNIVINEINYRSIDNNNSEFVEIYNNESTTIDLSGWSFNSGIKYTFPNGTSIGPDEHMVIAADPGYIDTKFSISNSLGPFEGGLSNDGEQVELVDSACLPIDKVEYESWNEWPAVRIDNSSATSGNSCLAWTSPNQSIANQIVNWQSSPIDISCANNIEISMDIEGIGTMEDADYLTISYAVNGGPIIVISDNINSFPLKTIQTSGITGNNLVLYVDGATSALAEIYNINNILVKDEVNQVQANYVSIQKINPKLPGNQPGSWSSNYPTPKTTNYSVFVTNSSDVPVIKEVKKSPDRPIEGEDVRVRADFSQDNDVYLGPLTVKLEYQINAPGDYKLKSEIAWNSIPMLDDGIGADSTADNGVYTAVIPGSLNKHRNLVRYRVFATTGNGQDRIYPDPRFNESNYAYFVYNGFPKVNGYDLNTLNDLQDLMVITKSSISNFYIGNKDGVNTTTNQYQGSDLLGEGTLVYKGRVYDHINFRPRGKGSRTERNKPGIKFGLNKEHPVRVETDCGDSYDVSRDKLILSGTWVNDQASHGLTESIIYKLSELTGDLGRYTDYTQVHIIDNAVETGNAQGDFFGVFLMLEDYNGDFLEEHGLEEGNFWGTNRTTRFRFLDYEGDFPGAATTATFAPFDQKTGTFTIDDRGNQPLLFGNRIAAELYGLNGNNYIGKHSYNEYYDSATQSYLGWWGDMDNSFGSPYDDVTVYPRVDANFNAPNKGNMIIPNTMQIEYQNEFRSVYDLMLDYTDPDCNCTQSDYLVDQESKKIFTPGASYDWTTVDKSRWNQVYDLGNYASQQNWYKTWFQKRKSYLTAYFEDIDIPSKPTITASNSTALDQLIFTNSAFSDLQGANTFAALEWRVGEWSDPTNPYYDQECEAKYEIETKWRSGELTSFTSTFQIPAEAKLKEDRTYLIRVRYKDDTGKWSHWSHPQKVVPTPAANPIDYGLVINEIMYNPSQPTHAEFIEIYNSKSTTVNLDHVQFNEGIDFEFAPGSSIGPESYICIAKDSFDFFKAYGYYPFSDYKGGLSNSGELIRLAGAFRTIIDTVRYSDISPWPSTPDKGIYSLALKNTDLPNEDGNNWDIQSQFVTPCQANQFNNLGTHPYSGIVINEIHYNPHDVLDASGIVIESGTKFEFIELKNISTTPIDMTGVFFSRGIDYAFDPGTFINPGEFFVLAEDKSSFLSRYGFEADGKYSGKLSNNGEVIWLTKSTGILMDAVTYGVAFPWDSKANGGQDDLSLALIDGDVDNDTRLNWSTQCAQNYTPGAENDFGCFTGLDYTGLTINEIHHSPSGGSSLEYVEIINNSNSVLNLEEVALTGGVLFVFGTVYLPPKIASPNNYLIVAKDAVAFQNAFGIAPHGEYTGVLSNNGETLILQDLFENQIDFVNYQNMVISNPLASQGSHSIALIDADLDNSIPESWCIQDVSLSPKSVNTFNDTDADTIIDCLDECPGLNDALMGTACEDGDPCTIGETYDNNCNCTGGVFADTDNDSICDFNDVCPGFDDTIDLNNNGMPDGCEGCVNTIVETSNPIISDNKEADISITTNGITVPSATIEYNAGQFLEFTAGFEVELGTVFHAFIQPCN